MRINPSYLSYFIKTKKGYLYPVRRGSYLYFNEDLEYKYVIEYSLSSKYIDTEASKLLEVLYSKSIVI